jgi:hypothetical protein
VVADTLRDGAATLADAWARPNAGAHGDDATRVIGRILTVLERPQVPREIAPRILKIPSCFHDFDCHPDDCRELVRRFAANAPDRGRPLTVVGIRTSGSYLAPLCVAFLRQFGFTDVELASVRPKVPLFRDERSHLRRRAERGAFLIVDDPPVTGSSLVAVVQTLRRLGVPAEQLVPLIFFESGSRFTGTSLDTAPAVVLPETEWRIRKLIAAPLPGGSFEGRTLPMPATGSLHGDRMFRCHVKARLAATEEQPGGFAKGTGVGWFEQHVRATASALRGRVPEGGVVAEGLFVTRWIEGPSLADRPEEYDERLMRHVAAYVAERLRQLPIRSGIAEDPADRETGWYLLAEVFARSYGGLAPFGLERWRRRLAGIARRAPRAEIDGQMRPTEWILPESGRTPIKIDFEEHGFDRTDRSILDPAYDLATFIVESRVPAHLQETLIEEYVGRSGDGEAPARLAAYELMSAVGRQADLRTRLAGLGSIRRDSGPEFDRAAAAVEKTEIERLLSRIATELLAPGLGDAGTRRGARGRLFAVDLDGVLEDCTLGFAATTPAGVSALRTLVRHGFDPVLATGRSLGEVVERCRVLGLQGGLAEYGSVAWVAADGMPVCLAGTETLAQLDALRGVLAAAEHAIVDPAYQYSVRVFRYEGGWRRAVARDWLERVLRDYGFDRLRIVSGEDQLDVVGTDCDKGRALRALGQRLGADEIHAAGDTQEDVAMWRVADRAYAPANVSRDALLEMGRARLFIARRKRQQGLLEIARVAAHGKNRSCRECGEGAGESDVLLQAFGIRDRPFGRRMAELIGTGALRAFRASH